MDYLADLIALARENGVQEISVGGTTIKFNPSFAGTPEGYAEPALPPKALPVDPSAPSIHPAYNSPMLFHGGKAPSWRKNTE